MVSLGSKKFWLGLGAHVGTIVATTYGGPLAGIVAKSLLAKFLPKEQATMYAQWVELARQLEDDSGPETTNDDRALLLEERVRRDLTAFYGKPPKDRDVIFNAMAALKDSKGDFEEG